MSRGTAFGILAGAAVLVTGTALFVALGIASGVWVPKGTSVARTSSTMVSWEELLDDVRDGRVLHVGQRADRLTATEVDRQVVVGPHPESADPFADIAAAADEVGVDRPTFDIEGQPVDLAPRTATIDYSHFLEQVRRGSVLEVTQQGSQLTVTTESTVYLVVLDQPAADVLADIEGAAREGSVQPPVFTKVPE